MNDNLKKLIKKIIEENYSSISVVDAREIGIDKFKKIKVTLSNGTVEYLNQKNLVITDSTDADYGCLVIKGIFPSILFKSMYYNFNGVDCKGYKWIDPKSITIAKLNLIR